MSEITNGVVSVEDGTKAGEEYAPARKVRVELHFEGDQVSVAGDQASAEVDRLLNRRAQTVPSAGARAPIKLTSAEPVEGPLAPSALALVENPSQAKTPRSRRTKAQIEADEAVRVAHLTQDPVKIAAATAQQHVAYGQDPGPVVSNPTEIEEPQGSSPAAIEEPQGYSPAEIDFTSEPATVAAASDADLNAACQHKAGTLGSADKIKALIGTFAPDPTKQFTLREIPVAQRADFLAKLEAL